MSKLNCWEFKRCGQHPRMGKLHRHEICPAVKENRLDGIHGGCNAGRSCWVVSNTLCKGDKQRDYATKFLECSICDFYKTVKQEEFPKFLLSAELIRKIQR